MDGFVIFLDLPAIARFFGRCFRRLDTTMWAESDSICNSPVYQSITFNYKGYIFLYMVRWLVSKSWTSGNHKVVHILKSFVDCAVKSGCWRTRASSRPGWGGPVTWNFEWQRLQLLERQSECFYLVLTSKVSVLTIRSESLLARLLQVCALCVCL